MNIADSMTAEEMKELAELSDKPKEKKQRPGITGYTAEELVNLELPPVKYIIPEILPEGLTIIAGRPKIGKSWLMMGLSVAVASGSYFLESIKVDCSRVLYLALEDNARRLSGRLKLVLRGKKAPTNLHLYTEWPRVDQNGAALLEKFIEKYSDTRLIVIDTLAKIKSKATNKNKTLYTEDYESMEPLKAIADKFGIAVVVVHHTRKSGSDDAYETISGTTGLTGGTDAMMVLTKDRARCDGILYITGRDLQDKELALKWDDVTTSWSALGNAAEYRMSQERQAIIEVLRASPVPMSSKEIADGLGKNHSTIRYNLANMYKDNQIYKAATGRYSIYNITIHTTSTTDTTNKQVQHIQQIQQGNMFDVVGGTHTTDTTGSNPIEINTYKDSVVGVVDVVPYWVKEAEKALCRGKGYKRALRAEQYEQSKIYPTQEDINGNEGLRAFNKNESEEMK